ncbi:MAG: ACT domain-containing protein, partial [Acidimicrobiia bacterium]
NIAKVSLVGAGMKHEFGIAGKMFRILADHHVNIEMISTSPIRISCVVRGDDVAAAVRGLHDGFELGASGEEGADNE